MDTPLDTLIAGEEDVDLRLDKWLAKKFPEHSRTYFQSLIAEGNVLVNGVRCKKRESLLPGDEVEICFTLKPELSLTPENIPLEILYEDEDLCVVNKPAGMVVHPAPGNYTGTFVQALLYHCLQLPPGDSLRPGIVHRLDKDTSGVLVAAKTTVAHRGLIELFSKRKVKKIYKAVCIGTPSLSEIHAPIKRHPVKRQEMCVMEGGKEAITKLQVVSKSEDLSLLRIDLLTGRTHQIRVHLKHIHCPILGDPLYGREDLNKKWKQTRQLLHAEELSLTHPRTGEPLTFHAPLPKDMDLFLKKTFPDQG